MDIFAHTLWAAAGARGLNAAKGKKVSTVGWTALFGVAPDFFAFGLPFLSLFGYLITGRISWSDIANNHHLVPSFELAPILYQYSHSLVIWAAVFALVWIIRKKPWLPLLGWALHILIDIPSHSIDFYPTPFLFPISDYRFPYGIEWSNQWYMIINYSALFIIFGGMLVYRWKKRKEARAYLESK